MQSEHRRSNAVRREQYGRDARILGGDAVDAFQYIDGAQRDVAQISDGRGHHI